MSVKLDNRDKKILFQLDLNARQSNSEIARKLRLNPNFVLYRIKNLERKGVINGYYTMIDFSKLGFFMVRVYIKLKNTSPELKKVLIDFVNNQHNIFWFASIEGQWDIIIAVLVRSHKEFEEFWEDFEVYFKGKIYSYNQAIMYEFLAYRKNYLTTEDNYHEPAISGGQREKYQLDHKDALLLKSIASNARKSLIDLAKDINVTPMAALHRIKKLQKNNIILGFRPMINLNALGYRFYKLDFELEDIMIKKELVQFAKSSPNIVNEDRTIGGSDFECDVDAKNHEEFLSILNILEDKYKEKIRNYRYYLATKIHKISYLPSL
jgi:Lrp/AsnC family leucine-responsive transcriptional regulator